MGMSAISQIFKLPFTQVHAAEVQENDKLNLGVRLLGKTVGVFHQCLWYNFFEERAIFQELEYTNPLVVCYRKKDNGTDEIEWKSFTPRKDGKGKYDPDQQFPLDRSEDTSYDRTVNIDLNSNAEFIDFCKGGPTFFWVHFDLIKTDGSRTPCFSSRPSSAWKMNDDGEDTWVTAKHPTEFS